MLVIEKQPLNEFIYHKIACNFTENEFSQDKQNSAFLKQITPQIFSHRLIQIDLIFW